MVFQNKPIIRFIYTWRHLFTNFILLPKVFRKQRSHYFSQMRKENSLLFSNGKRKFITFLKWEKKFHCFSLKGKGTSYWISWIGKAQLIIEIRNWSSWFLAAIAALYLGSSLTHWLTRTGIRIRAELYNKGKTSYRDMGTSHGH